MMGLRSHVAGAEHAVHSQAALNRQHVLLGIRDLVAGDVVWYPADGFKLGPIDAGVRMAGTGVQRSKRNRKILTVVLAVGRRYEWCGEQRRRGAGVSGSVRRIRAAHPDRERLNGSVKHAVAGSDAGFATVGRVGQADAWREVPISRRRQRARYSGIGWKQDAGGSGRENDRLLARLKRRNLIVFLIPGFDAIPAQPVVQSQVLGHSPAILRIDAGILIAAVEGLQLTLVVLARNAEQEVREIDTGLAAEEEEIAVQLGDRIGIDLIVVKLATQRDGVGSHYFGKVVAPLEGVVHLLQLVGIGADREVVEIDAFHAFCFGR